MTTSPSPGTSWLEAQRRFTEDFGRKMETSWASTQDFWKHLVVVESTVLGLTVGFIAAQDRPPNWLLVSSWVFLLLAIAAGSLLLKVGIDLNFDNTLRFFRFNSDVAGIMARVESGDLDVKSEEYQGLFVAASFNAPPGSTSEQIFTPKAKELAAKYADKLPTSPLFNVPKRTWFARALHTHWQRIETVFYLCSIGAFAFLLLSAVLWIPRPTAQSAPAAPLATTDSIRALSTPSLTRDTIPARASASVADSAARHLAPPHRVNTESLSLPKPSRSSHAAGRDSLK